MLKIDVSQSSVSDKNPEDKTHIFLNLICQNILILNFPVSVTLDYIYPIIISFISVIKKFQLTQMSMDK